MKILLIGPPGAGKGTQAQILSKKLKIKYYSVGEILRKISKGKSKEGKLAKILIEKNILGPPEFIFKIIKKMDKKNFILDGFPRNIAQLRLSKNKLKFNVVFYIKISDKEAKIRLLGRKICNKCKKSYGNKAMIPKKKNTCDRCYIPLTKRSDDNKKAIDKRLKIYHKETEPIIKQFKKENILVTMDGEQNINEVSKKIIKILKGKFRLS